LKKTSKHRALAIFPLAKRQNIIHCSFVSEKLKKYLKNELFAIKNEKIPEYVYFLLQKPEKHLKNDFFRHIRWGSRQI
jgi:hypothetical protein